MSIITWWHRRRERALRRKVAYLRAKAAAATARADQIQHNLSKGMAIPNYLYVKLLSSREEAARAQVLANHYAEETP